TGCRPGGYSKTSPIWRISCATRSAISRDRQDHMEYPLDQKMSYKASHGDADTNTEPPVSLQRTKPGFINTTVVLALGCVVVFAFDERKFKFQGDLVADQYAAGIQRGIPRDTPVFAIDAAGALESCAQCTGLVALQAEQGQWNGQGPGDPADG